MICNLKCLMFYCNMMKSANYSEKEIMSFVKCGNTLKKEYNIRSLWRRKKGTRRHCIYSALIHIYTVSRTDNLHIHTF